MTESKPQSVSTVMADLARKREDRHPGTKTDEAHTGPRSVAQVMNERARQRTQEDES